MFLVIVYCIFKIHLGRVLSENVYIIILFCCIIFDNPTHLSRTRHPDIVYLKLFIHITYELNVDIYDNI